MKGFLDKIEKYMEGASDWAESMGSYVMHGERPAKVIANPISTAYHLLPWRGVHALAELMARGIETHPRDSWRQLSQEEQLNRVARHLALYLAGDESEDHLSHLACRAVMALELREKANAEGK